MTKYVVVKGTSGIGNRVFAVATGIVYAQLSGRQLVVDWRDGSYSLTGDNMFFRYFDCPVAASVEQLPETTSLYPDTWHERLHRSIGSLRNEYGFRCYQQLSFDVSRLDYEEDIIVFSAYTHKLDAMRPLLRAESSHFAKLTTREILQEVLRSHLFLKEDISAQVESFKQEYFADYMIGIHIRYSDMKVPLSEVEACLQSVIHSIKVKHPNFKIFLATDSQEVLSSFRQKFPNLISTNKWFSDSGKHLHQNHQECEDLVRNGIEALVDLYLLAACDRLVFASRSSFGLLASFLMTKPDAKWYDIDRKTSLIKRVKLKFKKMVSRV